MRAKQITCRRCKGAGYLKGVALSQGVCFGCAGRGKVFADKFDEFFRGTTGEWFGFSYAYADGRVNKNINRCEESETHNCMRNTVVTKITEEQARKFFAKYGNSTTIQA